MNAVFGLFFWGEDGGFTQPTHLVISFFKGWCGSNSFFYKYGGHFFGIQQQCPLHETNLTSQVMAQMAATLAQTEGASGIILEELLKVELEARGEHPGGLDGGWIHGVGWSPKKG